jgi:hypothetical protein
MQIGETLFGYGGAGIVLSSWTMNLLHEYLVLVQKVHRPA